MKKLFVISFLLFFCYANGEENEFRKLHQTAEAAMNQKDYIAAKEAYSSLIHSIHHKSMNGPRKDAEWVLYIDVILRCAQVNRLLGDFQASQKLLENLLAKTPPLEYFPQIQCLQARLMCELNNVEQAYRLLALLSEKIPQDLWKAEDRSFFFVLESMMDAHFDQQLQKADQLMATKFYQEAIPFYQGVLKGIEEHLFPKASNQNQDQFLEKKIRFKLAEAHFFLSQYDESLNFLKPNDLSQKTDQEMLYLSAFAYKARHEYEKVVDCLQRYIKSSERADLRFYDEAICELGILYFKNENYSKSERYLCSLLEPLPQAFSKAHYLAGLYLSKLWLKNQEPKKVEQLLSILMQKMDHSHPLFADLAYARGEAAMMADDYQASIDMFETALTSCKNEQWKFLAKYELAWSYLKFADDPLKRAPAQESYLKKAEKIFEHLIVIKNKPLKEEKIRLALSHIHQLRLDYFQDEKSRQLLFETLTPYLNDFTNEGHLEALLLLAKNSIDYEEKEKWYQLSCESNFKECPLYGHCWYMRGLNHFQEALDHPNNNEALAIQLEKAVYCFQRSFVLLESSDRLKAFQALKSEAQASFYQNNSQGRLSSYLILEQMFQQYEKNLNLHEHIDLLFFKGVVAAHIAQQDHKDDYVTLAEKTFLQLAELFPSAECLQDAYQILGTLFYQKKNYECAASYFHHVFSDYPEISSAPEALFWFIQTQQKIPDSKEDLAILRRELFNRYPQSDFAKEAYFELFSWNDYLHQEPKALKHLKEFLHACPNCAFAIFAHFYLGLASNSLDHFEHCARLCLELYETNTIQAKTIPQKCFLQKAFACRYRSLFHMAEIFLEKNQNEKAEELLETICNDFISEKTELDDFYKNEDSYPNFLARVEFRLAKHYLTIDKIEKAQQLFSHMLHRFAVCGIKNAYFLSKIWIEQAQLTRHCKDYQTALSCFNIAEEVGVGHLTQEDFLQLWIDQSFCYREMKNYDQAMLLLSKVINEEAPSPLRIEAMLLRADIYELEGRYELAIRQLEAAQKKGGEWAERAKNRLKRYY